MAAARHLHRGPPSCPGEALTSPATLSTKHSSGFSAGPGRDPQSIVFLRTPEIELLYSGDAMRSPWFARKEILELPRIGAGPPISRDPRRTAATERRAGRGRSPRRPPFARRPPRSSTVLVPRLGSRAPGEREDLRRSSHVRLFRICTRCRRRAGAGALSASVWRSRNTGTSTDASTATCSVARHRMPGTSEIQWPPDAKPSCP